MTIRLSEQGLRKIDAFWANELGCLPGDFHDAGVGVTERQVTDDLYAHVFHRLERLQVDCSPSLYKDVQSAIKDRTPEEVFKTAFWQTALDVRVERIVGPTYLCYKDVVDESPIDSHVRLLGVDEGA